MKIEWVLIAILAWAVPLAAAPVTVEDDIGRTVRLSAPAKRVVSLAPHLTEILFALGVGDRIVGTARYSDYPEAATRIPRVGDAFSVNVESLIALSPDIVFAWYTGGANRALEKIGALGVPIYYNEAPRLDDIGDSVRRMARLVGRSDTGEALAAAFERELLDMRRESEDPVIVFFQISDQNLYTVNGDHLIGQAIRLCGGENLFADARAPVPLVSKEAVLAGDPDLIVITRVPGSPPSSWVAEWQKFDTLAGKVRTIDPNLISRPGLRMTEGIEAMCKLIDESRSARGGV